MSETDNAPASDAEEGALDLSGLGSFDFTPSWAKGSPDRNMEKFRTGRFSDGGDGDRPPRRERGFGGERGPRNRPPFEGRDDRDRRHDERPPRERAPKRDFRDAPHGAPDARPHGRPPRDGERAYRPYPRMPYLDLDIRVLPDQRALGQIVRKIQTTGHAYPLRNLARLFADNPSSIVLRIAPRQQHPEDGAPTEPRKRFWQCAKCGAPALSEDEIREHVFAHHLNDFFDEEQIECEPPKGNFPCIAKCGITGELIGPPNLHEYNARIQEILRTRCPQMREEEYRARIEMIRDPEVVEEWRKNATKKTVYFLKSDKKASAAQASASAPAPGAEPQNPPEAGAAEAAPAPEAPPRRAFTRAEAERHFRENIAPKLVSTPKTLLATVEAAANSPSGALAAACRHAVEREARQPLSVLAALRGAFRYRKFHFFRADDPRGREFTCAAAPVPLDLAHAVPELAAIVNFTADHPGATAKELAEALAGTDAARQKEVLSSVAWLAARGHIIAFFDGVLAVPAENPVYRKPRQKQGQRQMENEKCEESGESGGNEECQMENEKCGESAENAEIKTEECETPIEKETEES